MSLTGRTHTDGDVKWLVDDVESWLRIAGLIDYDTYVQVSRPKAGAEYTASAWKAGEQVKSLLDDLDLGKTPRQAEAVLNTLTRTISTLHYKDD